MGCNISGDILLSFILVSSLYIPVIIYSLLNLKKTKIGSKKIKFLSYTIIFTFIISFFMSALINPLNDMFYYNLIRINLVVLGFVAFVLCLIFFEKNDWKWTLPLTATFIGILITLSMIVIPHFFHILF